MNVLKLSNHLSYVSKSPSCIRFLQTTSRLQSQAEGKSLDHKSKTHGVYHWDLERAVSIAIVPLLVTPFVAGTGIVPVDFGIGVLLPIHCHLGLMQVIRDYAPKRRGPVLWNVALVSMYGLTGLALYGAYKINTEVSSYIFLSRDYYPCTVYCSIWRS